MKYKIIVEGCDGVGKTTLIKKLIKKYDITSYVHVNRHDSNSFLFYLFTENKTDVIFDRHFIGEMIYPKVFNRKSDLTKNLFELLLDNFTKQEKTFICILTADDDVLLNRIKVNEYDEVKNNIVEINRQFVEIGKKYNIPIIDTTKTSFEKICEMIEK